MIEKNVSLKPYNTFGMNVSASEFAEVDTIDETSELLNDTVLKNKKLFILGGGSNILFTKNVDALVIKINYKGIELVKEDDKHYYIKCAAGEVWHELVMYCVNRGYAGLENLSLIPGLVGACPIQNIGAYGVEVKDVIYELEALNIADASQRLFTAAECKFGYRDSIFKRDYKDQFIITSVTFKLLKQPNFNTKYGIIEKQLTDMGVKDLSIKAISDAVIAIRSSKLPDPKKIGNAGSFFKNPEIPEKQYQQLKQNYTDIVAYATTPGHVKLAAGWLIEKAGWKGKRVGDAGVHTLQALVLINYNNAKGNEIFKLSQDIIDDVKNKYGVKLEREVNIW